MGYNTTYRGALDIDAAKLTYPEYNRLKSILGCDARDIKGLRGHSPDDYWYHLDLVLIENSPEHLQLTWDDNKEKSYICPDMLDAICEYVGPGLELYGSLIAYGESPGDIWRLVAEGRTFRREEITFNESKKEETVPKQPETLREFVEEMQRLKNTLREQGQTLMKASFKKMFDQYPFITAFQWNQYTPYFNDGEECLFSVHDVNVTNLPVEELEHLSAWGEYEGELDMYDQYNVVTKNDSDYFITSDPTGSSYNTRKPNVPSKFLNICDLSELKRFLNDLQSDALEDVMKTTFGDHVSVIVTRDDIEINDYDHE